MSFLTDLSLLVKNQEEFLTAEKILPDKFTDFDSILIEKEKIKNLQLLPVKNDEQRRFYKTIDKNLEILKIQKRLELSDIFIQENQYKYFLPPDLQQMIIWLKDDISEKQIIQFVLEYTKQINIKEENIICFERPRHINIPLVQGTIKEIRHIHLWHKIK